VTVITIPHEAVIVCVEDDLARRHFYISRNRMPEAYLAHDPADAVELIRDLSPTHLFLDYDLKPGVDSMPVAEYLARTGFAGEVVITSQNPFGQAVLGRLLPRAVVAAFGSFDIRRGATQRD
jgi:hypothetical protein